MSNKPHKHAKLIKAWADGAEIEYQSLGGGTWHKASTPTWGEGFEFRVKPPEVLLEGVLLEIGQRIYYHGLNQNAPKERIVTDFKDYQIRTKDSQGEDQGFNHLQFFTRQDPKVVDAEEHKPLAYIPQGSKFYYVAMSTEEGFLTSGRNITWLEVLVDRGLVFSTEEGARQKFQKILKGLEE